MPSETIKQRASRPATMLRVGRYLKDIGRGDIDTSFSAIYGYVYGTVAEAAARCMVNSGPPTEVREKLAAEIKMMLHASRDCMRSRWNGGVYGYPPDPSKTKFVISDGYYGEAFGILRAVQILGWGEFGAVNTGSSLLLWLDRLENDVLREENFGGSGECDWCLKHYGKDGAGRTK